MDCPNHFRLLSINKIFIWLYLYIYRMTDMVKFLDPIIYRVDPNNVGWNITKEIVNVVLEVSNIASGST